jgi:host factor-I protein
MRLASIRENPHTQKAMRPSSNEFTSRRDRWQAAPEVTHREGEYIDKLSKNKTPVVVKLIDGEEIRGWIEYYDRDIIRVTRTTEPNLFIYKNRVKYLFEDPDARRNRT